MQNETNSLFTPVYDHSRTCKKRENLLKSLLFWGSLFPGVYPCSSSYIISGEYLQLHKNSFPANHWAASDSKLNYQFILKRSNYFGWFRKWFCQIMLKDQFILCGIVFKWFYIHLVTLNIGRNNCFSSSQLSKNNYPQVVSACC